MEETPPEQLVVELATKWTGEESVLLLAGEETDTPANENTENESKQRRILISCSSSTILSGAGQTAAEMEQPQRKAKQNCRTL
jgi:hypothetical protein